MPVYEYKCNGCHRRVSILLKGFSQPPPKVCPRCGSKDLVRLISRVAILKSEESRLEELASPSSLGDVDEGDPRSVAQWMRKMGNAMGEDAGPEFDEMVERMEAGETPEDMGDEDEGTEGLAL